MENRDLITSCTPCELEISLQSCHHVNIDSEVGIKELTSSNALNDDLGKDDEIPNPEIGTEFQTEKDAYNFYNSFGRKVGFSVRISNRSNDRKTGLLKMRKFVCSKEGKRSFDKRDVNVKHHRDETRTGCKAYMTIRLGENGKYHISDFKLDHNHILASPEESHLLRSQRKSTVAQAVNKQAGGRQNVERNTVDCKNSLRTKRLKAIENFDVKGLLEIFKRKQIEDPKFFYSIQYDAEDRITNIFWADGKMILDYEHFGDVICFDTTYKTNEYGRPFAPFLGVNHHRQTIIFGAALLYDETMDSFRWLFKTFCDAMSGKKPQTILTDQDKAMLNAIKTELSGTVHRICVWHMFQNACKYLSHLFSASQSFGNDFSKCIFDFDEEGEFLDAWEKMIQRYNLADNTWLQQLFNEKEKWAIVYGKNAFCADMKSTQRSESLNKELKRYLNPEQNIIKFFEHFERLVDDRRNAELEANFKMTQSSPIVLLPVRILEHAASVYTSTIFKLFQAEYINSLDQTVKKLYEFGKIIKYQVLDRKNPSLYVVTVNSMDESIACSCRKFEFMGILCCHILKATNHTLTAIPTKYILKRWTREASSISSH
ncbi:protein FAR1-RELATED SEQUENCE 5-like [Magnolia sinica]|uniref:protein FAR1-RELATED SEQUENCE 5-like n=1 Tax=Magnolia sinica TaxID=86752 RepID=UPI002659E463|nr:protein FAR1-RELATED SEQUENCE 5-like [Magnolia sinica]XP_058095714.1 protein FAR1-RELATED SEQUENCE 5-like [Magnolia sinica]XP_058095715.1 protein FAR1-RELATED SEQUENCE 5-like [Magnolia sinica]XP_058095716.1 protein FAR1-RELATED SEQUENCE 5-like [Magnolia sinica]